MADFLASEGMDPEEVATTIFDGIQRGLLHVHTHAELSRSLISHRMGDLIAGTETLG